ncbi:MAG: hypothetical protein IH869_00970 [Chloroflexi bacterium]|nr:hypothetical protein [Chloroflexota bacterium]
MGLYVGEIRLPTASYQPLNLRSELPSAEYFGATRGYWEISTEADEFGGFQPNGVRLTVELTADDFESAEDALLRGGNRLAAFLSVHTGSPLEAARLQRVAAVDAGGSLLEQRDYYYEEAPGSWPRAPMNPGQLETLVLRVAAKEATGRDPIELAMRWYGIAVGARDSLDSYLATWIGLEALGSQLDQRFHPDGSRAPCELCGNVPGEKRDRTLAGILHIVSLVAPEVVEGRPIEGLAQVRHDIVHSLKAADECREVALSVVADLLLCLGVAVLTVARPDGGEQGAMRAAVPREFDVRPAAMAWLRAPNGLPDHRPYLGSWVKMRRERSGGASRIEPSGQYVVGYKPGVEYEAKKPRGADDPTHGYVEFPRRGMVLTFKSEPAPEQRPWRDWPVSLAWQRLVEADQHDD